VFLVDTNVFLEILLRQQKKEKCKEFLNNNIGKLNITDFSLHSIGVILFRYDRKGIFEKFVKDITLKVKLLTLPIELYKEIIKANKVLNLDFDDAYQYRTAKHYGLKVVTMDKDFERVVDMEIQFL